jgi:hypothetical protein
MLFFMKRVMLCAWHIVPPTRSGCLSMRAGIIGDYSLRYYAAAAAAVVVQQLTFA